MDYGSETLEAVIKSLSRLPGIGRKTAERLALSLLRDTNDSAVHLGALLSRLRQTVRFCSTCGSITEAEQCAICKDPGRNQTLICVVEEPQDVLVLEKMGQFRGLYHVLHGVLSPLDGVGPEDLRLDGLFRRVKDLKITEVIVATNPTVEGDTTALYIAKSLEVDGCSVTRLARGLPMGATLEFADDSTLARALEKREQL